MNKNIITISIVIIVVLAAIGGYVIWNNYNPQNETNSNTTTSVNTNNNTPVSQAGTPIVTTTSDTVPYISTVVVKGTVNPNGALTTYLFEYGETNALGSQTTSYSVGSGYNTIYAPAYITGLRSNTNYYFRLNAQNQFGTSSGSIYSFKTNNIPTPTGDAPITKTVNATDITRTTVNLNGQINPGNSETTYWFEYGLTSDLGLTTSFKSAGAGNSLSSISVSVSNLKPLTKYYFRLNAQNQFGTVNGSISNFTTKGPATVSLLIINTGSASSITNSSASLSAAINPNGATATYWFEYSTNASITSGVMSTQETSLVEGAAAVNISVDINNLNSNTKYYYRIAGTNQNGPIRGDIKSFTTKK